jgi:hypothetical protein
VAQEWALTASLVEARRAYEVGLVNRLTPPGEALAGALELAGTICGQRPDWRYGDERILREAPEWPAGSDVRPAAGDQRTGARVGGRPRGSAGVQGEAHPGVAATADAAVAEHGSDRCSARRSRRGDEGPWSRSPSGAMDVPARRAGPVSAARSQVDRGAAGVAAFAFDPARLGGVGEVRLPLRHERRPRPRPCRRCRPPGSACPAR